MNFEPNQGRHRDEGLGWKRMSDQRLLTFAQSAATRNGRVAPFPSPEPCNPPALPSGEAQGLFSSTEAA